MVWAISAALGLLIVILSATFEYFTTSPPRSAPRSDSKNIFSKVLLSVVLAVTLHAAIDADHDRNTFALYAPQIARAVYAFASTLAVLFAFGKLRTWAGGALIASAVTVLEVLQWSDLLPGHFRFRDWLVGLAGVAAAVGPVWLGGHRARRRLASHGL